jgi:TonB family protein
MALSVVAVLLSATLLQGQAPAVSLSDLDTVKALYASASYEEVLQRVSSLPPASVGVQVEQFRALSLLALGRRPEAEQAIERLVRQSPFYVLDENEVSPRVAGLFRDVRQRVLPSVARDLYAKGKASFEAKDYQAASDELKSLLALLGDAELAKQADPAGDIKQLADGFLRLSELELAMAAKAAAPAPSAPAGAAQASAADATIVTKIVIYSASDTGVTPPSEIERRMPPWTPPAIMARNAEYRGQLEIVVDEVGSVESARMARPTIDTYDVLLLDAAKRWRFSPAKRGREAVKYRLTYDVALSPRR